MGSTPEGSSERGESRAEQADRNWNELLQEFRVLQTGVQLLAGFLLTLPFQSTFNDLDDYQRAFYLGLVVLAAATTTVLLIPIAMHRRVFRWSRKPRLVTAGHVLAQVAIGLVGLLVSGIVVFLFDVVAGRTAGVVTAVAVLVCVLVALVLVPRIVGGAPPE